MKMKSLLMGMLFVAGTLTTFAGTNVNAKQHTDLNKFVKIVAVYQNKVDEHVLTTSCKVTVSYGSTTVTVNVTCDCSQKASCDAAYKLATINLV